MFPKRMSYPCTGCSSTIKEWKHGHTEAKGASQRAGISREAALEVLANKGKVPIHEYLRLRVRYFVDGVALGNREYVERVFSGEPEEVQ